VTLFLRTIWFVYVLKATDCYLWIRHPFSRRWRLVNNNNVTFKLFWVIHYQFIIDIAIKRGLECLSCGGACLWWHNRAPTGHEWHQSQCQSDKSETVLAAVLGFDLNQSRQAWLAGRGWAVTALVVTPQLTTQRWLRWPSTDWPLTSQPCIDMPPDETGYPSHFDLTSLLPFDSISSKPFRRKYWYRRRYCSMSDIRVSRLYTMRFASHPLKLKRCSLVCYDWQLSGRPLVWFRRCKYYSVLDNLVDHYIYTAQHDAQPLTVCAEPYLGRGSYGVKLPKVFTSKIFNNICAFKVVIVGVIYWIFSLLEALSDT